MPSSAGNKKIIPVLTGPTGSGKTGVAIRLADQFPELDIISADSRQIYKYLNIGTDKPSADILDKYNFHLVDFVEPDERYTAFDFVSDSKRILNERVKSEGGPPLICGGTGLYIKSLVEGIVEIPDGDLTYRNELEDQAVSKGPKYLYEKLEKIDPIEATRIHPHNIKRIIRALEIYHLTGRPKSEVIEESTGGNDNFEYEIFCLMPDRENLYKRINERVDFMLEAGLLEEIKSIAERGLREAVSKVNVIGYNELFDYLDGRLDFEEAVNLIKQNSRRYAKRQITWFRGMENVKYFDSADVIYNKIFYFYGRDFDNA